jgi:hypothetical protein
MFIDLAAVNSGVCVMDITSFTVIAQMVSAKMLPGEFAVQCARYWRGKHLAVEDQPPNIRNSKSMKDAYRMQGRIMQLYQQDSLNDQPRDVAWFKPDTWQRHHGVFGQGKHAAIEVAEKLGWEMPTDRTYEVQSLSMKVMQDLADAYLGARYCADLLKTVGTLDVRHALSYESFH